MHHCPAKQKWVPIYEPASDTSPTKRRWQTPTTKKHSTIANLKKIAENEMEIISDHTRKSLTI